MEETLVIIKPDAFERDLCLPILEHLITRFELIRMKLLHFTPEMVQQQYSYLRDMSSFNDLMGFMVSRPSYIMIFKGDNIVINMQKEIEHLRMHFGVSRHRDLLESSYDQITACHDIKTYFLTSILGSTWTCGWCGKTGDVITICTCEPIICADCGHAICPQCGGILTSDQCIRRCPFFEDEEKCAGQCTHCDWRMCDHFK